MYKFILFIIFLPVTLFSFSATGKVYNNSFSSFGNDISAVSYNPASLYMLSPVKSEFMISADKEFYYNSFYIGWYLTRFYLLSERYATYINFALGMEKNDFEKIYTFSLGGTLIKDLKYGFNYKYIDLGEKQINHQFDIGAVYLPAVWLNLGTTIINLADLETSPLAFNYSLSLIPLDEIILSYGIDINRQYSRIIDYTLSLNINPLFDLVILSGYQKHYFNSGIGYQFDYKNESIYLTSQYDKTAGKFNQFIISYDHKFNNIFFSPQEKAIRKTIRNKNQKKDNVPQDILDQQQKLLKEAQGYYLMERFDEAKILCNRIIKINSNTVHADTAREILNNIKKVLQ